MTPDYLVDLAAAVVGVLSVARTARFIGFDDFPPMTWLRVRLIALLGDNWGVLITCPFCLTPYLATGMALWAWASDTNTWWWVINGVWGLSYLAAILVARDQPE